MIGAMKKKVTVLLAPASQTAAATRSANIDCMGVDFAEIRVNFAARVNTSAVAPTIAITESNDTVASNFATWSSTFSATESLANAHNKIYMIDTRTRKRYLNIAITAATHTTNDIVTAASDVTFYRESEHAAGTAALVGSTNDSVVVG